MEKIIFKHLSLSTSLGLYNCSSHNRSYNNHTIFTPTQISCSHTHQLIMFIFHHAWGRAIVFPLWAWRVACSRVFEVLMGGVCAGGGSLPACGVSLATGFVLPMYISFFTFWTSITYVIIDNVYLHILTWGNWTLFQSSITMCVKMYIELTRTWWLNYMYNM